MSEFVNRIRFLAAGQDDPQSIALSQCADHIDALEKALLEIFEVYAGSEGIPQPMNAAEGYLLKLVKEMANTARAALEGKDD